MLLWNGKEYVPLYVPKYEIPEHVKKATRDWIESRNASILDFARLIETAKARYAADPRFPGCSQYVAPPLLEMPEWCARK